VSLEEVGAFREKPDQLFAGDLRLTRRDHRVDLLDVVATLAGAAWLHDLPGDAARSVTANNGDPVAALGQATLAAFAASLTARPAVGWPSG